MNRIETKKTQDIRGFHIKMKQFKKQMEFILFSFTFANRYYYMIHYFLDIDVLQLHFIRYSIYDIGCAVSNIFP